MRSSKLYLFIALALIGLILGAFFLFENNSLGFRLDENKQIYLNNINYFSELRVSETKDNQRLSDANSASRERSPLIRVMCPACSQFLNLSTT